MLSRRTLCLVSLGLWAGSAWAADPTGTWSGKVKTDLSGLTADQKKQAQAQLDRVKVTMVFKKDHTFLVTSTGTGDGSGQTASGKWSVKGNTVSVDTTVRDGKRATDEPNRQLVMAANGKTMVMSVMGTPKSPRERQSARNKPGPIVQVVFKKVA